MNRRCCKSLSLWIVPLLLVRALIPTGFMLAADADGVSVVFCPASEPVSMAAGLPQEGHAGHHDVAGHDGAQHADAAADPRDHRDHSFASQHNAPCPFSLAAVAAAGEVPPLAPVAAIPAADRFDFPAAPTFSVGPVRADRIRGPPSRA